ncbi:uncharacterized protein LOC131927783 isoform X2 [Physella acuta]|nr:uncharacterized protein LOC131927783 isoform X2 [Physella acuta]XP_059139581.1 uncharacterized protein LOC131927783 isoform X2 [Physella acuta]
MVSVKEKMLLDMDESWILNDIKFHYYESQQFKHPEFERTGKVLQCKNVTYLTDGVYKINVKFLDPITRNSQGCPQATYIKILNHCYCIQNQDEKSRICIQIEEWEECELKSFYFSKEPLDINSLDFVKQCCQAYLCSITEENDRWDVVDSQSSFNLHEFLDNSQSSQDLIVEKRKTQGITTPTPTADQKSKKKTSDYSYLFEPELKNVQFPQDQRKKKKLSDYSFLYVPEVIKSHFPPVWQPNFEPSPLSNSAESLGYCALAENNLEYCRQTLKKTGSADSILLGTRSAQSARRSCLGDKNSHHKNIDSAANIRLHKDTSSSANIRLHKDTSSSANIRLHKDTSSSANIRLHKDTSSSANIRLHKDTSSSANIRLHKDTSSSDNIRLHKGTSNIDNLLNKDTNAVERFHKDTGHIVDCLKDTGQIEGSHKKLGPVESSPKEAGRIDDSNKDSDLTEVKMTSEESSGLTNVIGGSDSLFSDSDALLSSNSSCGEASIESFVQLCTESNTSATTSPPSYTRIRGNEQPMPRESMRQSAPSSGRKSTSIVVVPQRDSNVQIIQTLASTDLLPPFRKCSRTPVRRQSPPPSQHVKSSKEPSIQPKPVPENCAQTLEASLGFIPSSQAVDPPDSETYDAITHSSLVNSPRDIQYQQLKIKALLDFVCFGDKKGFLK